MQDTISVKTEDGAFDAYVAYPESGGGPAVVVLHEVFGVNEDIRQTCRALADEGFIAVAPDLFWRQQRGVDLSVTSESDWKAGLALYMAYDRDKGVTDVLATVAAARTLKGASGKVAVLGYCLGGLLTFMAAARGEVDAAVAFHGGDTDRYLGEAGAITAPFLMHLADEDEFIPKAAQAAIRDALAGKANVTIYGYPGCNHAFSRHGGAHYDAKAATLANERTRTFLKEALG
ncbi:carboxymethylenebutenolidase [Luteibacter sp. UNCMF331Sha3.1]|uniref:dienelactone hydrolase family protein n=1 Tax=Luteibacter sp. UNCMF331Sha3.1 TaxID=1502760 RepID=UPI0008D72226|nr:dienelactone hydrolase family protein [Luteibacter sp. UNCMF331Sha3.1]SEN20554.1 carboxymethylenebutenolidase [Luteibacter sp. UNCMF331Sha3.1]